ncbi:uncharacterized protein LOC126682580 [Mercurialis annua]|uniref:uncharacterized protein LOC126682580 n=1 Tax=Mercurialis annua TaxID=3986 RepID=UPI00215DE501|nr:uncharacterized protein LOC126682580 [Mercurialis annua]
MDALIASALEQICLQGTNGLSLSSLWSTLTQTTLTSPLKAALWRNLLAVPSLQFTKNDTPFTSADPKIQRLEDAEKLNLKIIANNHLRDCYVGLYDAEAAPDERLTLERLAVSRTNGITQDQLRKDLGKDANQFFYTLKGLETKKLIVKQPAVVRTKETVVDCEGVGESKNSSVVNTNLVYLSRYAKHLGVQQKFEINKGGNVEETSGFVDDVAIKDFLPAMKAICGMLQEAHDKVLIVSDIKQSLGYTGHRGHRAWRTISGRLRDAAIVEAFDAKVNGKIEHCLRLLKEFPPENVEERSLGYENDCPREQLVKFGRRNRQTEQLIELPIEHQIYEMIDAKKHEGATLIEVCRRLGLGRKKNDSRLVNFFHRFDFDVQSENQGKTIGYRVWTPESSNPEESNVFVDKPRSVLNGNNISTLIEGNDLPERSSVYDGPERSTEAFSEYNQLTVEVDFSTSGKLNDKEIVGDLCHSYPGNDQTNHGPHCPNQMSEFSNEPINTTSIAKLNFASAEKDGNAASSETTLLKMPHSGSYHSHPYLPLTVDGALREQRILERLKNEKFLLRVELHKWLMSLEKDKPTTMDRRTINRLLTKLQQEGHCKCVEINLPTVTNCTSKRPIMVVLHPSVQSFPSELVGDIHERLRLFEKESRYQASKSKTTDPIPVLSGVMRTCPRKNLEERAVKAEAMRGNGFLCAKMVRAKLLHSFLLGYLSSLPEDGDVLSTGPCECTRVFFVLEAAIKALPIQLFLKVVGTAQKVDNIVEKSRRGLLLSDLPVEKYKLLMDTQATGRLSLINDILIRLKLIRLIRNGSSENGEKIYYGDFTHGVELRPYIEEPLSVNAASNLKSLDLRPRIRHDFILSNTEAVAEYWKTLEYCYAAADPRAALHAFPGSSVPEVFHPRFWTSVRIMSAYQRSELLKRIVKDDLKKKITYEDCEQIARDLNLSLQQVLRAYYGKHQQRLNVLQGVVNAHEDHQARKRMKLPSTKKKRSKESSSENNGSIKAANEHFAEQGLILDTDDHFMEEPELLPSGHPADNLLAYHEGDRLDSEKELQLNQNSKQHSVTSQRASSDTSKDRHRRFIWTDTEDRQLLIQYTRHRAVLGSKVQRIDWNKIPDLPAPPKTCSKRVASLNRNIQFRRALMNFCTILSQRYAKHLQNSQSAYLDNSGCQVLVRCTAGVDKSCDGVENTKEAGFEEEQWDDFTDKNIKQAFEGVLLHKQLAKSQAFQGVESNFEELSNLNTKLEPKLVSSNASNNNIYKDDSGMHKDHAQRSRRYRLHQKFIKCLNGGTFVSTQVQKSLAVSNAVELLKLVFLSTPSTRQLQNHLAETLRRYSEHDVFAAFSYLREKKIMIGGDGDQPFELSQQFLQNVSKSLFPSNTGKRAAKFSGWLYERKKDLMEGGISLTADLECGDIFQLFALVYSGELSICPCLPDKGVGEAEDLRSSKRKAEDAGLCDGAKSKKFKSLADSELISRREKGFPGITVLLHRASIVTVDAVDLFNNVGTSGELNWSDKFTDDSTQRISSASLQNDDPLEILNAESIHPSARWLSETLWEAMVGYAEYLMLKPSDPGKAIFFTPEVFRTVYMAIQKAGDQGLSLEEVSKIVGEDMNEHVIDVLQAFGFVLKVNAYDSVHVVDSLYRSKYLLTSLPSICQDLDLHAMAISSEKNKDIVSQSESHDLVGTSLHRESIVRDNRVHKVTILNIPEADVPSTGTNGSSVPEGRFVSNELHLPILPWVNGNGSINKVIHDGLVRRVLGVVMRNPGILEENIIQQVDVLNPQSCRSLLESMILDKHLIVRKMHQTTSKGPPALLGALFGGSSRESSKSVYQKHFFANTMSASML